ncbi:MAG TPA: amidohydrolase family protein, partial [Longimicrobiales bacterium]|nr:amidohydrolase family protein [Longimicrobiales bacterium]
MKRATFLVLGALLAPGGCTGPEAGMADLVLLGGVVWPGTEAGARAEAVAVRDGRVLVVGSRDRIGEHVGPGTEVVDLEGRAVLPGFIDAHTHFISGGFQLSSVNLRDAATPEELVRRIGEFASGLAPGTWITGGDWDHERWGGELPRREWIDSVTPENPVLVSRL